MHVRIPQSTCAFLHGPGAMLAREMRGLAPSQNDVRHWLREGHSVVRITGTERVTETSLAIDEYEQAWATEKRSTE